MMEDRGRLSRRNGTSRKQSTGQQQVGLALRSRGAESPAVVETSADAVRPREADTQYMNRPLEVMEGELEQLEQHDLNPASHLQPHPRQFPHPVSELPAVASRRGHTSSNAAPAQASVITNLTATNPEESPTSGITNPVHAQDQSFRPQQRNHAGIANYQYSHQLIHPSYSLSGSASHDALYARPFQEMPYIHDQYPEQQVSVPAASMTKYSDRPMEILNAMQYDDGAASAAAATTTTRGRGAGQSQKHSHSQVDSQDPVFGLTGHFEHPETRVKGRSRTQTSRAGNTQMEGGERRRKKQKLSDDEDDQDESTKKARGRPRLDTKDETAADVSSR